MSKSCYRFYSFKSVLKPIACIGCTFVNEDPGELCSICHTKLPPPEPILVSVESTGVLPPADAVAIDSGGINDARDDAVATESDSVKDANLVQGDISSVETEAFVSKETRTQDFDTSTVLAAEVPVGNSGDEPEADDSAGDDEGDEAATVQLAATGPIDQASAVEEPAAIEVNVPQFIKPVYQL